MGKVIAMIYGNLPSYICYLHSINLPAAYRVNLIDLHTKTLTYPNPLCSVVLDKICFPGPSPIPYTGL
jgi:hypothetical protein